MEAEDRPRIVLERLLLKLCEDRWPASRKPPPHLPASPKRFLREIVSNVRTIKSRNRTRH